MSWKTWNQAAEKGPVAIWWKVLGFVLLVTIVLGAVGVVFNPFRQGARILEKTMDADNVIYNYEYFKRQWRAIEAIDRKIEVQQKSIGSFEESAGQRKEWTRDDRIEHARLSSIVVGLEQQRADMVAEYNARAAMANRQIFMGGDCPDHVE
jgi:hypothetical protein